MNHYPTNSLPHPCHTCGHCPTCGHVQPTPPSYISGTTTYAGGQFTYTGTGLSANKVPVTIH